MAVNKWWVLACLGLIIFLLLYREVHAGVRLITDDRVRIKDYKAKSVTVKMDFTASDNMAEELVSMIKKKLTDNGFFLGEKGDFILSGNIVVDLHETEEKKPYQFKEITVHEVGLVLNDLTISTPENLVIKAHHIVSGYGRHPREIRAFAKASEMIMKRLEAESFFQDVKVLFQRRDIIVDISGIDRTKHEEHIVKEVVSLIREHIEAIIKPQLKKTLQSELLKCRKKLEDFVRRGWDRLDKIESLLTMNFTTLLDAYSLVLKQSDKIIPYQVKREDQDKLEREEDFSFTGVGIIIDKNYDPIRKKHFEIYDKDEFPVYAGKQAMIRPIKPYSSEIRKYFKEALRNVLEIQTIKIDIEGGICKIYVSKNDAKRIALAYKKNKSIFNEGKIFVILGNER